MNNARAENLSQGDAAFHYDDISPAWQWIFGEHFHFGVFEHQEDSLNQASVRLIQIAATALGITDENHIVDLGGGIGGPACWLAKNYLCQVKSVSNSRVGIEIGRRSLAEADGKDAVEFVLSDACETPFSNETFDLAWIMESSHLFKDKAALFNEAFRLLRPKGKIMICDLVLGPAFPKKPTRELLLKLHKLRAAFGPVQPISLAAYESLILQGGFVGLRTTDLSAQARPTPGHWLANIERHRELLDKLMDQQQMTAMQEASEIVHALLERNEMGYALLTANRP